MRYELEAPRVLPAWAPPSPERRPRPQVTTGFRLWSLWEPLCCHLAPGKTHSCCLMTKQKCPDMGGWGMTQQMCVCVCVCVCVCAPELGDQEPVSQHPLPPPAESSHMPMRPQLPGTAGALAREDKGCSHLSQPQVGQRLDGSKERGPQDSGAGETEGRPPGQPQNLTPEAGPGRASSGVLCSL